jgi:hypothetical protein
MIDLRKIVGHYDPNHPSLDPSTPWYFFISYCEVCESLDVPQPSISRFLSYRKYLKSMGLE